MADYDPQNRTAQKHAEVVTRLLGADYRAPFLANNRTNPPQTSQKPAPKKK